MHNPMPAESVRQIEAFDSGSLADDRMMIGRYFIQAGPTASRVYLRLLKTRNAIDRPGQDFLNKIAVEIGVEAVDFLWFRPGHHYARAFASEVKSVRHIDDHRQPGRHEIKRFGVDDLASERFDRQINSNHLRYRGGPRTGGVHDSPRFYRAPRSFHRSHFAAVRRYASDLRVE